MSSGSFASTVDLALRPSARAHFWLFGLHMVPLAALPLAMPSGYAMAGVACAIGASWLWLRRHPAFGYGRKAIRRIVWREDGGWSVTLVGERAPREARLRGDSTVWSAAIVLNFDLQPSGRAARILVGDESDPEALRRLRARLAATPPTG
ncbi:MAG TPA: protein YgfX [Nevskiaceae bacterium]|nr:protein YgfX [Nevskiaceae bacterium]